MIDHRFGTLSSFAITMALVSLAFSSGCRDKGLQRIAVWGNVTWKGKPVPAGVVYFSPDTKKGNKGPQGFALIKQGSFDTRDALSKGCVAGPHIVIVNGCDGQGISSARPYGRNLFAPHEMPIDISAEGGPIDLNVPGSAAPPAVHAESDIE